MVTVTIENNEFKFHGTFNCGYAGLYRDDQIFFDTDAEHVRNEGLQGKDLSECSDEELAVEMAAYYNTVEAHVQEHIQQFNDTFLDYLIAFCTHSETTSDCRFFIFCQQKKL